MGNILLQALRTRETGMRKPVRCKLEPINITASQSMALAAGERVEFEMIATVSVKFCSTKRDFEYAKAKRNQNAEPSNVRGRAFSFGKNA